MFFSMDLKTSMPKCIFQMSIPSSDNKILTEQGYKQYWQILPKIFFFSESKIAKEIKVE